MNLLMPDFKPQLLPPLLDSVSRWARQVEDLLKRSGFDITVAATDAEIRPYLLARLSPDIFDILPDPITTVDLLKFLKALDYTRVAPLDTLHNEKYVNHAPSVRFGVLVNSLTSNMDPASDKDTIKELAWTKLKESLSDVILLSPVGLNVKRFPTEAQFKHLDEVHAKMNACQSSEARGPVASYSTSKARPQPVAQVSVPSNEYHDQYLELFKQQQRQIESLTQRLEAIAIQPQHQQNQISSVDSQGTYQDASEYPTVEYTEQVAAITSYPSFSNSAPRASLPPPLSGGQSSAPQASYRPQWSNPQPFSPPYPNRLGPQWGEERPRFYRPPAPGQRLFNPQQTRPPRDQMYNLQGFPTCFAHYRYGRNAWTCSAQCAYYPDFLRMPTSSVPQQSQSYQWSSRANNGSQQNSGPSHRPSTPVPNSSASNL